MVHSYAKGNNHFMWSAVIHKVIVKSVGNFLVVGEFAILLTEIDKTTLKMCWSISQKILFTLIKITCK